LQFSGGSKLINKLKLQQRPNDQYNPKKSDQDLDDRTCHFPIYIFFAKTLNGENQWKEVVYERTMKCL